MTTKTKNAAKKVEDELAIFCDLDRGEASGSAALSAGDQEGQRK